MNDSGTPQGTGTVDDAAERIASLLGPADSEVDETKDEESSEAAEDDADEPLEGEKAEAEDGEQSDDEDEPEAKQEQPELYTVKVAGEEVQVTLEEALRGYSREADYTRKTQAVKAMEQELSGAREEYLAGLKTVQQIIEANQPRVDQSLRQTNPAEWSAQMLQHQQWAAQAREVNAETERLNAEAAKKEADEHSRLVAEERTKLFEAIPEWSDPKVLEAETPKLISHGAAYGFTPEEIGEVVDHRAMRVLRDAMLYRELVAKSGGVKAAVEAKKVSKPGVGPAPKSKVQDLQRAKQRLRQSGSVDDAEAAILRML